MLLGLVEQLLLSKLDLSKVVIAKHFLYLLSVGSPIVGGEVRMLRGSPSARPTADASKRGRTSRNWGRHASMPGLKLPRGLWVSPR